MKRRSFLKLLGLATAAPTAILAKADMPAIGVAPNKLLGEPDPVDHKTIDDYFKARDSYLEEGDRYLKTIDLVEIKREQVRKFSEAIMDIPYPELDVSKIIKELSA